ncbi:MAG TPA: hypothetical protein VLC30_11565 [Pseudomonas sp.]|nr:hypothetical protein [Pseudomonas sp.]
MRTNLTNRMGASSAVLGVALLFIGTLLHPMEADPNVPAAAFAEYAADHHWVTSHLLQLAGVTAMVLALLLFAGRLQAAGHAYFPRVASTGAVASLALAAALQAVDGVALKAMVNAWAAAPEAQKEALFYASYAVRQIEVGLACMFCLAMGFTAGAFGAGLLLSRRGSPWFALLALAGGIPTACAGVVMAYSGFSALAMAINMPANLLLLVWMLWLAAGMWRASVPGAVS